MSKLIIRGIRVEKFECYSAATGGAFTMEVKCRADWTEEVCTGMGWQSEPKGFGNGKLGGKLTGVSMAIEPNAKLLKDYAIDISVGQFSSFRHIAKTEDGKTSGREFEFVAICSGENAIRALPFIAAYIEKCGPANDRGQARITYNSEEQPKLPGTDDKQTAIPGTEPPTEKPRGRRKTEAVQ